MIDFVARLYGLPGLEAAKKLAADFGISYDSRGRASPKPARRSLSAELRFLQAEKKCFRVLSDYLRLLVRWETAYAPKSPGDGWNPLFVEPFRGSITVRKIFDLAKNGTGVTGIVRYLNEKGLPTPIQYAHSNGLTGNFAYGTGDWNSRSVKYILTNRTYTGMLVQGKEKRIVKGTHEPLVNIETFDRIQREFKARSFNIRHTPTASENIFKGKVICACCEGKMQRKRGTNHANWYFFTCITKNRLGADKCIGMYVREEDIFSAVYYQLKLYIDHLFITKDQYEQEIQHLDSLIEAASLKYEAATDFSMKLYEQYVMGEGSKEAIADARPVKEQAEVELNRAIADKEAYEKQYRVFCKLLKASRKEVPLSEIVDCIEQIVIDVNRRIVVKWAK